jgi:hypothetical protein
MARIASSSTLERVQPPPVVFPVFGYQRDVAHVRRARRLAPHHRHDREALLALGEAGRQLQQFRTHGLIVSLPRKCW